MTGDFWVSGLQAFIYFFDKCLPFSLSTSCTIFEEVAKALEVLVRHHLWVEHQTLDHYLDDFIGCTTSELADDTCSGDSHTNSKLHGVSHVTGKNILGNNIDKVPGPPD